MMGMWVWVKHAWGVNMHTVHVRGVVWSQRSTQDPAELWGVSHPRPCRVMGGEA